MQIELTNEQLKVAHFALGFAGEHLVDPAFRTIHGSVVYDVWKVLDEAMKAQSIQPFAGDPSPVEDQMTPKVLAELKRAEESLDKMNTNGDEDLDGTDEDSLGDEGVSPS